jgi:antitoxin Xre/MbcA/ParS-like protein
LGAKRQGRATGRRKPVRPAGIADAAARENAKRPSPHRTRGEGSGVPDEAAIRQALADLGPAGQGSGCRILAVLAEHLGSPEAARLWMVTPSPELGATPLAAISAGKADLVLALLESRWGPNPTYA